MINTMGFFDGMFGDNVLEAENVNDIDGGASATDGPDDMDDFDGNEEPTLESVQIMNEIALLEAFEHEGVSELLENTGGEATQMLQTQFVSEATLVRLDKKARISQLQKASVFTIARERKDPKFKKLLTIWKMERRLENELMQKYGTEGMRRAKRNAQQNYRQRGKFYQKVQAVSDKKMPAPGSPKVELQTKSNVVRPK